MKNVITTTVLAVIVVCLASIVFADDAIVLNVRHATSTTWSTQASATTEIFGSTAYRTKVNLTNALQARLIVNVKTAGASGSTLAVQYTTDFSTWNYLDGSSGPSVSISSTGLKISNDLNITSGALTDVYLRIVGAGGNGIVSPKFGDIAIGIKPSAGSSLNDWSTIVAHTSTWSTQPSAVTEFLGTTVHRTKADLTNSTQARLIVQVETASDANDPKLAVQYSTDLSTWNYLDGSSGPNVSITSTGLKVTSWLSIATAAKADVYIRIVGLNGNGSASPSFGTIELQSK